MCHTHRMMQEIDIINEQYVSVDNDRYYTKIPRLQLAEYKPVTVGLQLQKTVWQKQVHGTATKAFLLTTLKGKKTLSIIFIKSGLRRTSVVLTEKILYFSYAIKTELNVSIIDLNTTHQLFTSYEGEFNNTYYCSVNELAYAGSSDSQVFMQSNK